MFDDSRTLNRWRPAVSAGIVATWLTERRTLSPDLVHSF
jgi:hypothetical protein